MTALSCDWGGRSTFASTLATLLARQLCLHPWYSDCSRNPKRNLPFGRNARRTSADGLANGEMDLARIAAGGRRQREGRQWASMRYFQAFTVPAREVAAFVTLIPTARHRAVNDLDFQRAAPY
jgi:hypothetical protein